MGYPPMAAMRLAAMPIAAIVPDMGWQVCRPTQENSAVGGERDTDRPRRVGRELGNVLAEEFEQNT